MLYLIHGEDEFRRTEWLTEIKQKVSLDEAMASLNTAQLSGLKLTPEELEANCAAAPFLADKRLVIVDGLAARAEARQGRRGAEKSEGRSRKGNESAESRLAAYLANVPDTTDLVLNESGNVSPNNPFLQAVKNADGRILGFHAPRADSLELREWVMGRAYTYGAQLSGDAVDHLLAYLGNNLRLFDQELAKLATYADGKPISGEDVYRLVAYVRESNVFEAMDAMGKRDTRQALRRVHALLAEGQPAQYLFTMVVRQVRLLIHAREALDRGISPYSLSEELGIARFPAQKVAEQARNFSLPTLLTLHDQLVELDYATKTGRMEVEAAIDTFIASVGRR